jgi:glycosyltransferase involved in cell wall biosynthesis
MVDIAVILPAYNEEQTISACIEGFHRGCPEAKIWVINNCSTDATEFRAAKTIEDLGIPGGVIRENRKGKGNAIRCAFTQIEADIYVLADADCTYSPSDLRKMLEPVLYQHVDMVVGDRHVSGDYESENKRAFHGFGNRLVRNLVNYLFKAELSDILSGYRVFSRRFVKTYPVLVDGFEIETDMTLHALDKRMSTMELPITYRDRPEGSQSKLNTITDGFRVLQTLSNILRHYRPFTFFCTLSFIFFLTGLLLGFPVIKEFIDTNYISHIPLAILSTGVEIIAVFFIAIGIILDSIVYHNKQVFEREFMQFDSSSKPACKKAY